MSRQYHINTLVEHPDYSVLFRVRDVLEWKGTTEVLCVAWSLVTEAPEYFLHPIEHLSFKDGTPLSEGTFTPVPTPEGFPGAEIVVEAVNALILDVPWKDEAADGNG